MKQEIVKGHNIEGLNIADSIDELMQHVGKVSKHNQGEGYWDGIEGRDKKWLGMNSFSETIDAINNGWEAGTKKVQDAFDDIHIDIESTDVRRRKIRSDFGDEVDMQDVYAGNIDKAWRSSRRIRTRAPKQITLVVELSANCGTKSGTMFWRGAAAMFLADKLTDSGYSVGVYGAACLDERRTQDCAIMFPVKPHSSPLDLSQLAATLGLSGFFRTAIFGWLLTADFELPYGMGKASSVSGSFKKELKEMGAISGFETIDSKGDAEQFITKTIKSLNSQTEEQ